MPIFEFYHGGVVRPGSPTTPAATPSKFYPVAQGSQPAEAPFVPLAEDAVAGVNNPAQFSPSPESVQPVFSSVPFVPAAGPSALPAMVPNVITPEPNPQAPAETPLNPEPINSWPELPAEFVPSPALEPAQTGLKPPSIP